MMRLTAWMPHPIPPVVLIIAVFPAVILAESGGCLDIEDERARLECYDAAARAAAAGEAGLPAATPAAGSDGPRPSLRRGDFVAQGHRPNYLLASYVHDPNVAPFLASDPEADLQHQEIKFQISLKVPLWNDIISEQGDRFGNNLDLWFGYTQLSLWQAINFDQSAPFRESNYEPEFGLTYRGRPGAVPPAPDAGDWFAPIFESGRFRLMAVAAGFAHQSNGRSEPLSRSWNRIWLLADLRYGRYWSFLVKPWFRVHESRAEDDNPEIQEYMGRAEFVAVCKELPFGSQLSAALRNNLRARDNRSGYQLDWTFPAPFQGGKFKIQTHFYNGYGESLIDHDVRVRRVGIGVLVNDWR